MLVSTSLYTPIGRFQLGLKSVNINKYFSYHLDGTYNSDTGQFEWTKSYYRTLVYKLSFALIGVILIYILYQLIKYNIPDAPRYLVERKLQTESILREKRKLKMKVSFTY